MVEKPNLYLNHTKDEINSYLEKFKVIVKRGNFFIPQHEKRLKNKEFIYKYRLTTRKQQKMLLSIDTLDFCYSIDDDKNCEERLYIFAKEFDLDSWGEQHVVLVYVKTVMKGNDYIVIVSFHEPEREIKKLFIERGIK
ncbi:MAG: hypothetical protein Q4G05_03440 [Clostridia bacterium]|nr:hypothetical protein [Clostridia bacterium]